jgi:hypothetical protein
MQFWNPRQPIEALTADWFSSLLENGGRSGGIDFNAGERTTDQSNTVAFGLNARSDLVFGEPPTAQPADAQPADLGPPVVCELPDKLDSAQSVVKDTAVTSATELWAVRPPALRTLPVADAEASSPLARMQPEMRSQPWWQTWDGAQAGISLVQVERLPEAVEPLRWDLVHQELAVQLASAPEVIGGEQPSPSPLSQGAATFAQADVPSFGGGTVDDTQVLVGRLRKAFG